MLRFALICCLLSNGVFTCRAHDFVAVFFDDQSAKELHVDAPLPRDLVAEVITKLHAGGARALVLKFFYDLPSDPKKDEAVAKALCLLPTALQACHKEDGATKTLPERFRIPPEADLKVDAVIGSDRAYLPLPLFSQCAQSVGFVDLLQTDSLPLIEAYQNSWVKSLYVCALELQFRTNAIYKGTNVIFGSKVLGFDSGGEHPIKALPELHYIPFHHVLNGSAGTEAFKNKVVILGYQGRRIHTIKTKWGEIEAHRLFVQSLLALTTDLEKLNP